MGVCICANYTAKMNQKINKIAPLSALVTFLYPFYMFKLLFNWVITFLYPC